MMETRHKKYRDIRRGLENQGRKRNTQRLMSALPIRMSFAVPITYRVVHVSIDHMEDVSCLFEAPKSYQNSNIFLKDNLLRVGNLNLLFLAVKADLESIKHISTDQSSNPTLFRQVQSSDSQVEILVESLNIGYVERERN